MSLGYLHFINAQFPWHSQFPDYPKLKVRVRIAFYNPRPKIKIWPHNIVWSVSSCDSKIMGSIIIIKQPVIFATPFHRRTLTFPSLVVMFCCQRTLASLSRSSITDYVAFWPHHVSREADWYILFEAVKFSWPI